jgi:hypothetical protein
MGASASRAARGAAAGAIHHPPVPGAAARQAVAEAEARAAATGFDFNPPAAATPTSASFASTSPPSPPGGATSLTAASPENAAEVAAGAELGRLLAGAVRARPDPAGFAPAGGARQPPKKDTTAAAAAATASTSGRLDARILADLLTAAARGEDTADLAAGADPALVAAFLRTARAVTLPPPPPPPPGAPPAAPTGEGKAFNM